MTRWLGVLAVFLCTATVAHADVNGFSEPEVPSITLVEPTARGLERIAGVWARRRQALERGDAAGVDSLLDEVVSLRRELGIQRLDALGVALVREADALRRDGKLDLAGRRLDAAERLAPGLPEIADARGTLAATQAPFAVHRRLLAGIEGARRRSQDFSRRMIQMSDATLSALIIGAALALLFLVAQLARYGVHLYHDLGRAFPSVLRPLLVASLALLAVLPLFYGFGPFLLVSPVLIVLWAYQGATERILSVVFAVGLAGSPWALRAADRLSEAGTGVGQALHALSINPLDERAEAQVREAVAADETDWYAQAVLGVALKRQGKAREAARLLSDAARVANDDDAAAAIWNNLGNTWFALGRPLAAQAAYEQATRLRRRDPIAWFNLHRLHQRSRQMPESEAALAKASASSATRVSDWNGDDDTGVNRFVVDAPLPDGLLVSRALDGLFRPSAFAHRVWQDFAGPLPEVAAAASGGAALLAFVLLFMLRERFSLSWPCARCGQQATVHLSQGRPDGPVCTQCDSLFVRNVPTDRRTRFEKESQIGRHQVVKAWARRIAAIVLPGFGPLTDGRPLRGLLLAGLAGWLLLRVWLPGGLLHEPFAPRLVVETWVYVGLGLVAVAWLATVVQTFRTKGVH